MGRKRLSAEPLSSAEKQQRYRARHNAERATLKALRLEIDALKSELVSLKMSQAADASREAAKADKKKIRESMKKAEQEGFGRGRVVGVCESAAYFVVRGEDSRPDLASFLLGHFMIDREKAQAALEKDKRTVSLHLASLDKYRVWDISPPILK